jgi:hypothetical protein
VTITGADPRLMDALLYTAIARLLPIGTNNHPINARLPADGHIGNIRGSQSLVVASTERLPRFSTQYFRFMAARWPEHSATVKLRP